MITTVILAKNEEENIGECLKTLKWCDEVIVVDDLSIDKTVEIAKKNGAKVFSRELKDDFASQRNYGMGKVKNKWVLFIDADERVSSKLRAEIQTVIKNENTKDTGIGGFYLKREDVMWGRVLKHGEAAQVRLLRLGRRKAGKWQRKVDEVWEVVGKRKVLKNPLTHHPHPDLTSFLTNINFYSTLNARELYESNKKTRFWDWLKPLVKFFQNYVFRLGFLDGMPGFTVALLMSFHSFLVRAKLYLLWKREGGWR